MTTPPKRRLLRLVVLWSCGLAALLGACYLARAPLLRGAARAWIVNDAPATADAIVVLGGGLETRPFAAARLYHERAARKVLVTQPKLPPTAEMGLTTPEFVLAREVLRSNGVPAGAIEMIGTNVTSTVDEARALKAWLAQNQAHSVIIPTDLFHTRRARWIFNKVLRQCETTGLQDHKTTGPRDDKTTGLQDYGTSGPAPRLGNLVVRGPVVNSGVAESGGPVVQWSCGRVAVRMVAVEPPHYTATNWWRHEEGLIAFQNEVVKSVYYHLKY